MITNYIIIFLINLIDIYELLIFVYIIFGLVIRLDFASKYKLMLYKLYFSLGQMVEPVFAQIRRILPVTIGMIDLSPLILFFLFGLMKNILLRFLY